MGTNVFYVSTKFCVHEFIKAQLPFRIIIASCEAHLETTMGGFDAL
jgi:hypothetical protein